MEKSKKEYPLRFVARVVIEFTTAFHIGTGRSSLDGIVDMDVITDANGLATLPGDSLAGMLRAAWTKLSKNDTPVITTENLFGMQTESSSQGSRLDISWGYIHNSKDSPVTTILPQKEMLEDSILLSAVIPDIRNHCRINHRGAADVAQHGLFNEYTVCAGHRFTFELHLTGTPEDEELVWRPLLHLLHAPWLRIGGKSRRGLGAFRVVTIDEKTFDLSRNEDFYSYTQLHPDLSCHAAMLEPFVPDNDSITMVNCLSVSLPLTPRAYWMFGGGDDSNASGKPVDMAPVYAHRISWGSDSARLETVPLVPSSSIKGSIAHRVAFHYNILQGIFADDLAGDCGNTMAGITRADKVLTPHASADRNQAVKELFGFAKNNNPEDSEPGEAGRQGKVLINDTYLAAPPPSNRIIHAPLDRFTAGTINLFEERPFYQGAFPVLNMSITDPDGVEQKVREALLLALRDLCQGRLPLGAGAGRGLGRLRVEEDVLSPVTSWVQEAGND